MARRSDHTREELKKEIIKVSSDIVGKDGPSSLTARNVASIIGYAPGTIYNIFGSMDELYLAVNSVTLDTLYSTISNEGTVTSGNNPAQNIKKMAYLYRDFAEDNKPHWLMLFTYALPDNKVPPTWYQEKIARLFEPLEEMLRPLYTDKQSRKRKMAARVVWASVHGICFLEKTGKIPLISNQENPPDMMGYLIDNFIAGLEK